MISNKSNIEWGLEYAHKIREKVFYFCRMQQNILDIVGGEETLYPPPQRIF